MLKGMESTLFAIHMPFHINVYVVCTILNIDNYGWPQSTGRFMLLHISCKTYFICSNITEDVLWLLHYTS